MTHKVYAGTQIRELRQRLGLTQAYYAQRLGVSTPYLSQMENNHRFNTYDVLTPPQTPIK
jgi:transcriptional regulator with XRE-family HTH domain